MTRLVVVPVVMLRSTAIVVGRILTLVTTAMRAMAFMQLFRPAGPIELLAFTGNTNKKHSRDEQKEWFHRAVS